MPLDDAPGPRPGHDRPPSAPLPRHAAVATLVEPDLDELRAYARNRTPPGTPPLRRPLHPLDSTPAAAGYPGDRRRPRPAAPMEHG